MARTLPILAVTFDGRPTTAHTTGHGAADVVVLTTAAVDTVLTLTSVYLSAGQGTALAAHLIRALGRMLRIAASRIA